MSSLKDTAIPVVAWLLTDLDLQPVIDVGDDLFAFRRPVLVGDKNDCIPVVRRADAEAEIDRLRAEVAELAQQRGGLAAELLTSQLFISIGIERLIAECVPGGSVCDPQAVADAIRRYCKAWPNVASESQPSEQTR